MGTAVASPACAAPIALASLHPTVLLRREGSWHRRFALRTLDRYIFREVATTWIAVTGVLLLILLSNQLARVLSQAAANDFPQEVVLTLIVLTSAGYVTVVVPIGFFLAIMLSLGRLYHESEMAAIQACGVGPGGLYRPIGVLGVLIAVLLAWLSFFAVPSASARAQAIRVEALRDAQFGLLEPGRFRTFGDGDVVFYAERVDEQGVLHNVNVFVDHSSDQVRAANAKVGTAQGAATPDKGKIPPGKLEIWVATRAEQRGAGQADQTFVLYDGQRYEGVPGEGQFRIIKFSEGGIPVRLGDPRARERRAAMKPTAELLESSDLRDIAELHWRSSTPVLVLVLMIVAVPLARLRPRQGRFGKLGAAILIYFLYSLLLDAARTWVENGTVPVFAGPWWVHASALAFGLWLLLRSNPLGRATTVR
jgi:lipopolysaccharide export system permease protein